MSLPMQVAHDPVRGAADRSAGGANIVDDVINPAFSVEVFNRTVKGLRAKTEVWCHTCWGNPSQQRMFPKVQSYKSALEMINKVDADVVTFE